MSMAFLPEQSTVGGITVSFDVVVKAPPRLSQEQQNTVLLDVNGHIFNHRTNENLTIFLQIPLALLPVNVVGQQVRVTGMLVGLPNGDLSVMVTEMRVVNR